MESSAAKQTSTDKPKRYKRTAEDLAGDGLMLMWVATLWRDAAVRALALAEVEAALE